MKVQRLNESAQGVFVIAATPFTEAGEVDFDSIDSLVDFYMQCGVHGMTIMGVMGEAHKLTESEANQVAQRYIDQIAGRVPIIVGVTNPSTGQLVRLSNAVMQAGAAGVMVQPIPGLKTDQAVSRYLTDVVSELGDDIPVCVQDYPQLTGVHFSAQTLIDLVDANASIVMFKHEEWPGMHKLSQIRNACDGNQHRRLSILCGNGGMHLPQEYLRGSDGAMTGFAYPDMLVQMHALFAAGEPDKAEDLYDCYLPLIRHEYQVGLGLALRKETLRRRGAIRSATVRKPGPTLNAQDLAELDRLLARVERRVAQLES